MRRNILTAVLAAATMISASALDITVTPGSLAEAIEKGTLENAAEIALVGDIDARDLSAISRLPAGVAKLDLSKSPVIRYKSRGGKVFNRTLLEANVIPEYCFFRSPLSDVVLPAGTVEIGAGAFAGATVSRVVIPQGVVAIGDFAFYDCPNLSEIVIPASVKSIGKGAFGNCSALNNVNLSEATFSVLPEQCFAGCVALREIVIPASVKTVEKEAFRGAGIYDLELPGVAEFQPYALSGMANLETVVLSANAKVGEGSLMDNPSLIGVSGTPSEVPHYFAANCVSLNPSQQMQSAQAIGDYAFANSAANQLIVGGDVTSLGKGVFHSMGSLLSIDVKALGSNIPYVEENTFDGIRQPNIKLYVAKGTKDAWAAHPQWGLFDIDETIPTSSTLTESNLSQIDFKVSGGQLMVTAPENIETVMIYSVDGHNLAQVNGSSDSITIDLQPLQQQIVIVTARTASSSRTAKLMY